MKTTRFLLMFVAMATMMLASCGEKDNGPSLTDNNIIALNNDIVSVESTVWLYVILIHQRDYTSYGVQALCERCHFLADIEMPLIGTTIDLTKAPDAHYGFSYEGDLDGEYYEIRYSDGYGNILSYNQDGEQIEAPAFASGTLTTVINDNGFTLTINGTLTNGKTFVARVFVAKENIGTIY